jgi:ribose/xylose/arabinose/galactoside ABC-type transport system permease subunit
VTPISRAVDRVSTVHRLLPSGSGVLGQKLAINVAILAVIWIVLAVLTPRFLTGQNLANVLRQIATIATVGSVVTLLMVSRNFDLSVGGLLALSGCVSASLANSGWPVIPSFAAGIAVGALVGAGNGVLVVFVGINSVIATLGTMYLSRGSALLVTNGLPVYSVPDGYNTIGTGYLGPIPIPVVIMAAFVLVMTLVARRTVLGKYARATGSNPHSARLSGVPTRLTQFVLFVLAGAAGGWGGVMISSRVGGGYPTVGVGFEFEVVVAAVLGGTSLAGGQGSVVGTFLGALIVGSLNNGFDLLGIPTFWQTVALGIVLLLAIGLDTVLGRRRQPASGQMQRKQGTPGTIDPSAGAVA